MHVAFWYQHGKIDGIGTGHRYRSKAIAEALSKKGHRTTCIEDDVISSGPDVIVIDHLAPPPSVAERAKRSGMKVVVIDGNDPLADVSISAFFNENAKYSGIEYIAFPIHKHTTKYIVSKKSKTVFVSMGGYDKNNYARVVLEVLREMDLFAIVAKSINHTNFEKEFPLAKMFHENNYYDAMHECILAITNGGLSLFQSLHYGMPTIAIAQYDHQVTNIDAVNHCCVRAEPDKIDIEASIMTLTGSAYCRKNLSDFARYYVDGKGVERICDIIEGLAGE
jgi:spore coat polysaccharide biosynthesis predicted glycosyltransferase SpsG